MRPLESLALSDRFQWMWPLLWSLYQTRSLTARCWNSLFFYSFTARIQSEGYVWLLNESGMRFLIGNPDFNVHFGSAWLTQNETFSQRIFKKEKVSSLFLKALWEPLKWCWNRGDKVRSAISRFGLKTDGFSQDSGNKDGETVSLVTDQKLAVFIFLWHWRLCKDFISDLWIVSLL